MSTYPSPDFALRISAMTTVVHAMAAATRRPTAIDGRAAGLITGGFGGDGHFGSGMQAT